MAGIRHAARAPERPAGTLTRVAAALLVVLCGAAAHARQEAARPSNPLAGKPLYVEPDSEARRQAETWKRSKPQDAALLARIASQPVARWFGGWAGNIQREVNQAVTTMTASGALPVFVAYNIPARDCGSNSAGGASNADAYRRWMRDFSKGLGGRRAVVILEPDALAGMDCLNAAARDERVTLLREAVQMLESQRAAVYIDAGNARWQTPAEMAQRLTHAGIAAADGFSLNVSNVQATSANIAYGEKISALVGGKHFIVDTSRNGIPGTDPKDWCNPRGRALGRVPTTNTGHPLIDAFLWVKRPGESDGTCGGGPPAGTWWSDYALELSRLAGTLAGMID